jgi:hypothetical protein
MPAIEPSAEFSDRLQARLRAERRRQREHARRAGYGGPGFGTLTALTAGMLAAGFVVVAAFESRAPLPALQPVPALALAPVVVAAVPRVERPRLIVAEGTPVLVGDSGRPRDGDGTVWRSLTDPTFESVIPNGMPGWPTAGLGYPSPAPFGAPQLKLTKLEQ